MRSRVATCRARMPGRLPQMQVLRLGNSYEFDANIAPEANKTSISDRFLTEATGETVETTARVIWPQPELPELVERWLDRYQPDLVLLVVSSYWFTSVSLPLGLERRFGRIGRIAGRAGERLVRNERLVKNPGFRVLRKGVRASLGGVTHFEPEEVNERMEACIRRIVAREDVALAVRGPRLAHVSDDSERAKKAAEARRLIVHRRMAELCRQLHIEYLGYEAGLSAFDAPEQFQGDLVHVAADVHAEQGRLEAEAMLAAWSRVHRNSP